ncbi:hypothetical protein [Candidatus Poriferisodalis sp.]|uniref:hypothetical protein n=1 Tax=Candidatus Poriferisodalis sp. TaxID=3101277 RepID=UPI003B5270F8
MIIDCLWSSAVARWSESGIDDLQLALPDPDVINPRTLRAAGDAAPGLKMT